MVEADYMFWYIVFELNGWYNVNDMSYKSIYLWMTVIYNASVTLSLYSLAIFGKSCGMI